MKKIFLIALLSLISSNAYAVYAEPFFQSHSFSDLPPCTSDQSNGAAFYCIDCKNISDDGTTIDSTLQSGGHGTLTICENHQWRIH